MKTKFIISNGGAPYIAWTPEGALCKAALMIYFGPRQITEYREALKNGREVTIIYGFKSVTITPEAA